ncbi:hypothetical protein D3C80_1637420 [compost metagenome]
MHIKQIRDRADHQHVMAARHPLNKGVLVIQSNNFAVFKTLIQRGTQFAFTERFDMQFERQIQIQRIDGLVPVFDRDFPQLAAHQIERTFHQIVHGLTAGAFCGDFVHQPDQHRHHQKTDQQ